MIGTTRSRVSFFMNEFRKLGLINYNVKIEVHSSLLNAVLYDKPEIKREQRPRIRNFPGDHNESAAILCHTGRTTGSFDRRSAANLTSRRKAISDRLGNHLVDGTPSCTGQNSSHLSARRYSWKETTTRSNGICAGHGTFGVLEASFIESSSPSMADASHQISPKG